MKINIANNQEIGIIATLLKKRHSIQTVIMEAARPCVIAALSTLASSPVAVVCANPQRALRIEEEVNFWLDRKACTIVPENETIPYQRLAGSTVNAQERVEALGEIISHGRASAPPVIIFTARTLAFKTVDHGKFADSWVHIKKGQQVDLLEIMQNLAGIGYKVEGTVTLPGQISRRGGILDVFPVGREKPVRIDFFGDEIDEIRDFDPLTQRSTERIEECSIGPGSEISAALFSSKYEISDLLNKINLDGLQDEQKALISSDMEKMLEGEHIEHASFYSPLFFNETILNYLPAGSMVILEDADSVQWALSNINTEEEKARRGYIESGYLPEGTPSLYFGWEEIESQINPHPVLYIYSWELEKEVAVIKPGFGPVEKFGGSYSRLRLEISKLVKGKKRVAVVSHQAERIGEILAESGINSSGEQCLQSHIKPGQVVLYKGILDGGWCLDDDLFLYTDSEILGFTRLNRQVAKKSYKQPVNIERIKPGDYVVHVDHGIARFAGIINMDNDGISREFMVLEYEQEDRLYVPVNQVDRVSRYIGSNEVPPSLNRLGTEQWQHTRQKAAEAAREIAAELLALYTQREIVKGFAFSGDSIWQKELEASFPYVETPDQLTAIEHIKKDMSKPRPMDRLLLGDVGYGKTEVAIRASFKAVQDGRQVAVLVPTTLLAQQHYITFSQRLSAYPVTIESLSRFKTAREQKEILTRLKEGGVDIVIGTHRLLQQDVKFKNLGLIIIDEEQRFGVGHKELLKKKRAEVDVLAMSATPIPRTLYMSLTGVRDMSTIETPPEERLPVHTMVARSSRQLMREAIIREVERNGQVFFVHNRVRSIVEVAAELKDIVPEARFSIAHGQMEEEELAQVMLDFTAGKTDVLVCTTIIESGLDVPNANTLIVNRADKFGLIQLHQLRGRVGRGTAAGYAYFIYDDDSKLTEEGRRRLRTIYELAELGSGFNIAMKDLEIRGAGTLLGTQQSGHIAAVGFNMYTELLSQAVEEEKARLKGKKVKTEKQLPEPVVDLPLAMLISQHYVPDDGERIHLYRRLAGIDNLKSLEDISSEMIDRFGAMEEETSNLIYGIGLKILARSAGVGIINVEDDDIIILPYEGLRFKTSEIEMRSMDGVRLSPYRIQLNTKKLGGKWRQMLESLLRKGISHF